MKALEMARNCEPSPNHIKAVAAATSDEAARWAFTQWQLRRKAKDKFPSADKMLFTREALEQATPWCVAKYHASHFPEGALVADLTAGIGGDLLALSARGPVVAFETDPERAACAEFNTGVRVRIEDCLLATWDWDYAFADPSRRTSGRRTTLLSEMSPDPMEIASRMRRLQLGGIKLSPMIDDRILLELAHCVEFISYRRQCISATLWTGKSSKHGRFAVLVAEEQPPSRLESGGALPSPTSPADYVYDADPAAVRAHCLGSLCAKLGLSPLADSNGYLTGGLVQSEWLRRYRVLATVVPRERDVRRALRSLSARVAEVKSRVTRSDRFHWLGTMAFGERSLTAILYPEGSAVRVLLCEPLDR